MAPPASDGVLLATILGILEDNPKPNLLFGAPAVSLPHVASNLNMPVSDAVAKRVLDVIAPLCDTFFDIPRKAMFKELKRGTEKEGWIVFEENPVLSEMASPHRQGNANPNKHLSPETAKMDVQDGNQVRPLVKPILPPIPTVPQQNRLLNPPPVCFHNNQDRVQVNEQSSKVTHTTDTRPANFLSRTHPDRPAQSDVANPGSSSPSSQETHPQPQPKTLLLDPTLPGGEFPLISSNTDSHITDPTTSNKPQGLSFLKPLFLRKNKREQENVSPPDTHRAPIQPSHTSHLSDVTSNDADVKLASQESGISASVDAENHEIIDLYDLDGDARRGRYPTFPAGEKISKEPIETTGFDVLQERARARRLEKMVGNENVPIESMDGTIKEANDVDRERVERVEEGETNGDEGQTDVNADDGLHQRQLRRSSSDLAVNGTKEVGSIPKMKINARKGEETDTGPISSPPLSDQDISFDSDGNDQSDVGSIYDVTPPPTPFLIKAFEDLPFGLDLTSSGISEWFAERWQLLLAELIVLLGLAYFVQASGF